MPRQRVNGNILGPINPVSNTVASGVWTVQDYRLGELGSWPADDTQLLFNDTYFRQTAMLLHADGSNNANGNVILDSSDNNFTITRNGDVAQGTFSPFSQTGWSVSFNGSTDYFTTASNAGTTLGTSSFTVEAFIYPTVTGAKQIFDSATNGFSMEINANNNLLVSQAGGSTLIISSDTIPLNTWSHCAVTRDGTTTRLFINGSVANTQTLSTNFTNSSYTVGRRTATAANYFPGYISNARIIKGAAQYTSAFTPPTTPLTAVSNTVLLFFKDNRIVDSSINGITLTKTGSAAIVPFSPFAPTSVYSTSAVGGSGYFDGTGDYLDATLTATAPGTGDFTYECWAYVTSLAALRCLWTTRSGNTSDGFQCAVDTGGELRVGFAGSNFINSSAGLIKVNEWFHVAVTRLNGVMTLWHNGVSIGTSARSENFSSTTFRMGAQTGTLTALMSGYISSFRSVIGTASYTSGFSVPTSPFTSVTGTSFLVNFTNGNIIDSTAKNNLQTVGNTALSTAQSNFGGSSLFFDGTGDWLAIAHQPYQMPRTGDFTWEFWARTTAGNGTNRGVLSKGTSTTGISIYASNTNFWAFSLTASNTISSNAAVTLNTWQHVALNKTGTTVTLYVDGVQAANATSITTDFNQTSVVYVGAGRAADIPYTGYIDELRMTTGQGRYTANFTPSATAFQNL